MDAVSGDPSSAAGASSASAFADVVSRRRSAYAYLPDAVPRSVVEDAIGLALLSPNHHKTRPWRFHVYAGDGRMPLVAAYEAAAARLGRDVAKARQRALDAPVMIVVACIPSVAQPKVKRWEEEFAVAAAVQTMLLALAASGVDSLITTGDLPESVEVRRLIGLDADDGRVMAVVNTGYRDPRRPVPPRPDTAFRDVVHWMDGT